MNGVNVKFRIDSGADVTVVPKDILKLLCCVNIMPLSQILSGQQCDALNVERKFIAMLEIEYCCHDTYLVKNVFQPLLGWPAIYRCFKYFY